MAKQELWTIDSKYDLRKTPIRVYIGGQEIEHLSALRLTNSMTKFSDTIELTFTDTFGQIVRNKKIGDAIKVDYGNQTIFKGKYELLTGESSGMARESTLKMLGRADVAEFALNTVTPKKYKKTTDNAIIQEQLSGGGYSFDLATAVTIDEMDSGTDGTIGQFVSSVAQKTNHYLWNEGTKIFKQKVLQSGSSIASLYNTYSDRANVLSVSVKVDSSKAQSKLRLYANSQRTENKVAQFTKEVTLDTNILYKGSAYSIPVTRVRSLGIDAKQQNLVDLQVEKASAESVPEEVIQIIVKGFRFFPLNKLVSLVDDFFAINGKFVVFERTFELNDAGLISTEIQTIPLGKKGLP